MALKLKLRRRRFYSYNYLTTIFTLKSMPRLMSKHIHFDVNVTISERSACFKLTMFQRIKSTLIVRRKNANQRRFLCRIDVEITAILPGFVGLRTVSQAGRHTETDRPTGRKVP